MREFDDGWRQDAKILVDEIADASAAWSRYRTLYVGTPTQYWDSISWQSRQFLGLIEHDLYAMMLVRVSRIAGETPKNSRADQTVLLQEVCQKADALCGHTRLMDERARIMNIVEDVKRVRNKHIAHIDREHAVGEPCPDPGWKRVDEAVQVLDGIADELIFLLHGARRAEKFDLSVQTQSFMGDLERAGLASLFADSLRKVDTFMGQSDSPPAARQLAK